MSGLLWDLWPEGPILLLSAMLLLPWLGSGAPERRGRAAALALLLLGIAAELGCFDGRPHVAAKFDGTSIDWLRVVLLRGAGGAAALLLSWPLARALGRHGVWGVVAVGLPGAAALASALILWQAYHASLTTVVGAEVERLALLRVAIGTSQALLWAGALLGAAAWVQAALSPRNSP